MLIRYGLPATGAVPGAPTLFRVAEVTWSSLKRRVERELVWGAVEDETGAVGLVWSLAVMVGGAKCRR